MLKLPLILMCLPIALLDFAMPKWKADPSVRVEDAYKYLYQATMGGEHAAPSRDVAKERLDAELTSMGDEPKGENLWEPLCPDGSIGRLNLRPFRAAGGKPDDLLDAFLGSVNDLRPDPSAFVEAWTELGRRLRKSGTVGLDHKEWLRLDTATKPNGYPALSHSDEYRKARRPAYRVLALDRAQMLIPN